MATKQELLNELNNYDAATLQKLVTIAESILDPSLNYLTRVDFSQMLDYALNTLAPTYFPEWTDKSASDFGRFLVELMAVFSDKDFFYINMFYNEGHIQKAKLYSSLVDIADSLEAEYSRNVASNTSISIQFDSSEVASVDFDMGVILLEISGTDNSQYVSGPFTLPAGVDPVVAVPFHHGIYKTYTTEFNGRSVLLPDRFVADGLIEVFIDGNKWTETVGFSGGSPSDQHYRTKYGESSTVEIFFPRDASYGELVPFGTEVEVRYLINTGGATWDLPAGTFTEAKTNNTGYTILSFSQPSAFAGGAVPTPLEELRNICLAKRNVVNIIKDGEAAAIEAKARSEVYNAYGYGYASIMILHVYGTDGAALSAGQKSAINDDFAPFLIPGIFLSVSDPIWISVNINIDVSILAGFENSVVAEEVKNVMQDYYSQIRKGDFGKGAYRSQISKEILSRVASAQNTVFTTHEILGSGDGVGDIIAAANEIIDITTSTITFSVSGGEGSSIVGESVTI